MNLPQITAKETKIILFSLLIAVLVQFYLLSFPPDISIDGARYLFAAENIVEGYGYYEPDKYHETLVPQTKWPPVYSLMVAATIKVTGSTPLTAFRIVNFVFGLLYFFSWTYFLALLFRRSKNKKLSTNYFFLTGVAALFLGSTFWIFMRSTVTEIVFLGFLGLSAVFFSLSRSASNHTKSVFYISLSALFTAGFVLTRMAGLAFFLAYLLAMLLYLKKPLKKSEIVKILTYIAIVFAGLVAWFLRNSRFDKPNDITRRFESISSLFDLDKILQIISFFFIDGMNLPNSLREYAILAAIPLIFIVLWILLQRKKYHQTSFFNIQSVWVFLSLFIYVSMVVYTGTTGGHNRSSGFVRYFITIQPFILIAFLILIHTLHQQAKTPIVRFLKYGLILFFALVVLSGINRNRVYFTGLQSLYDETALYQKINETVQEDDLLLSGTHNTIAIKSGHPCLYVEHPDRIRLLLTEWLSRPYEKVYFVQTKALGTNFRYGFPTWDFIVSNLPVKQTLYEDDEYIFVEIDKSKL